MDFKTRFQGRTSTMDKSGVIGVVSRTSQPINKQTDSQIITTNVVTQRNQPSYYFQKFQRNGQQVLQMDTDADMTPSTRSEYPSYKFRQDFQKLNMDEYEIVAIPKKVLEAEKYSLTHSFAPPPQYNQLVKTQSDNNYSRMMKNVSTVQQQPSPFVQAGYGALKQKQLYLQSLRK